jgi:hypothetical protein
MPDAETVAQFNEIGMFDERKFEMQRKSRERVDRRM